MECEIWLKGQPFWNFYLCKLFSNSTEKSEEHVSPCIPLEWDTLNADTAGGLDARGQEHSLLLKREVSFYWKRKDRRVQDKTSTTEPQPCS